MIDFFEAIKTSFQLDKKYRDAKANGYHPIDRKLYNQFNRFRPNGPKQIFCYLPYNSLTFSFGGQVFVCSYNRDILLGMYPQNSIDEIWNGAEAKKLREHMNISIVGHITDKNSGVNLISNSGNIIEIKAQGWDALRRK